MSQVYDRPHQSVGNLELTVRSAGRRTVVILEGELCLASEPVLRHSLEVVMESGCRHVVLDLSELSFVDARGLAALVRAARVLKRRGGDLELRSPQPWPYHVIDIAGLGELFETST